MAYGIFIVIQWSMRSYFIESRWVCRIPCCIPYENASRTGVRILPNKWTWTYLCTSRKCLCIFLIATQFLNVMGWTGRFVKVGRYKIQMVLDSMYQDYKCGMIKRNELHVGNIQVWIFKCKVLVHLKYYLLIQIPSQSDFWLWRYQQFLKFQNKVKIRICYLF